MYLVLLKIKRKIYFESLIDQDELLDFIDNIEDKFGEIDFKKSIVIKGNEDEINSILMMIDEHFYLHTVGRKIDDKVYKNLVSMIKGITLDVKTTFGIEFEGDEPKEEDIEDFPEPEPVKHTPIKEKAKPHHRPPEKIQTSPAVGIMDDLVDEEVEEEVDDYFVPPISPIVPKSMRPEPKVPKPQPIPIVKEIHVETTEDFPDFTYSVYVFVDKNRIIMSLDEINDIFDDTKSFKQSFENLDEALSLLEGFRQDFMEIISNESGTMFEVNERLDSVREFIESKISMLDWKGKQAIKYFNGRYKQKKVEDADDSIVQNEYLTAKEVMKKLRISDQTLANWRRNNLIDFRKISSRKYLYMTESVNDIFENGVDTSGVGNTVPSPSVISAQIRKIDYEAEIIKMLKPIAFKIPEYKFKKQNFFLNFGNLGLSSSPQVMINNDFQLVDYIKKNIIFETPKEVYEYLIGLFDEGKEPRVDTSKKIQKDYDKFYLNTLLDKDLVS